MTKDGGSAFPVPGTEYRPFELGMSLRDYFAGQALQGMAAGNFWGEDLRRDKQHLTPIAEVAYMVADAMLAERQKEREGNGST